MFASRLFTPHHRVMAVANLATWRRMRGGWAALLCRVVISCGCPVLRGAAFAERRAGGVFVYPDPTRTTFGVASVAAPVPLFWFFHQSAFHRIAVHVAQLLNVLLLGEDVEVVEAPLPEPWRMLAMKKLLLAGVL